VVAAVTLLLLGGSTEGHRSQLSFLRLASCFAVPCVRASRGVHVCHRRIIYFYYAVHVPTCTCTCTCRYIHVVFIVMHGCARASDAMHWCRCARTMARLVAMDGRTTRRRARAVVAVRSRAAAMQSSPTSSTCRSTGVRSNRSAIINEAQCHSCDSS